MLDEMTLEQFYAWRAYSMIEPFLGDRLDQIGALIAKTLWDINRDPKKHPRTFDLKDFLIVRKAFLEESTQTAGVASSPTMKQSAEDRVYALRMWAAAMTPTLAQAKRAQEQSEQATQRVQSAEAIAAAKAALEALNAGEQGSPP